MKSLALMLATIALVARAHSRAPFQVSIQLKNSNQHQICSGVIIHEEFVLTTANCFYLRIAGTEFSFLATAGDLTVITTEDSRATERNVVSIIPHHKFNKTTHDNDIAVLKLDRALPLVNSTEIQWLDIATSNSTGSNSDSCFLAVFNSSQTSGEGFYSIWKNPASCVDPNSTDLCLEYALSTGADCNSTSISLAHSSERGTAYVCNNKLVGLLTDINPPASVEKCFEKNQTTGAYVDVRRYVDWLRADVGVAQQSSSAPSWTLEPTRQETSTTASTGGGASKPSSAARISNEFVTILLLMKLVF